MNFLKGVMQSNRTGLILILSLVAAYVATAEEVELKFVVKAEQIQGTLKTFTHGKDGEERDIYFLETDGMALSQKGIILRLRKNSGKADESTVNNPVRGPHKPVAGA